MLCNPTKNPHFLLDTKWLYTSGGISVVRKQHFLHGQLILLGIFVFPRSNSIKSKTPFINSLEDLGIEIKLLSIA
jgi:hypothetical protein